MVQILISILLSSFCFCAAVKVEESDKMLMELDCRFGNFCDQFVGNKVRRSVKQSNVVQFLSAAYQRCH